ncbi:unnamed protein product [Linum tenue]|uniref:Acid phosphatase 1 n=1 Tax=Linum tenue TaxID=586396 RepID=A0AAV0MU99_9ROSI|nr:unnamed protein product [Linum tenue]
MSSFPVPLLFFFFFSLFVSSVLSDQAAFSSHLLPRPLILEYPESSVETLQTQLSQFDADELTLQCTSWRVAGEANNLNPWKTIPDECLEYVRGYVNGKGYLVDLQRVAEEAVAYAKGLQLQGDGKDVWVFDIDETLLSNLPYYKDHGYGAEVFNPVDFDMWVDKATAPALEASLKLYQQLLDMGFKIILLTGRSEAQRAVTEQNLRSAGFQSWDRLILRATEDHGKLAATYKSEKRDEMLEAGYRILGNSGDQWSDLLGWPMSTRSFKLPNPMYYIS